MALVHQNFESFVSGGEKEGLVFLVCAIYEVGMLANPTKGVKRGDR